MEARRAKGHRITGSINSTASINDIIQVEGPPKSLLKSAVVDAAFRVIKHPLADPWSSYHRRSLQHCGALDIPSQIEISRADSNSAEQQRMVSSISHSGGCVQSNPNLVSRTIATIGIIGRL